MVAQGNTSAALRNWITFKYLTTCKIHRSLIIEKCNAGKEIHLPLVMIMFKILFEYSYSRQGNTSAAKNSGNNYFVIFSISIFFAYLVKVIIYIISSTVFNYLLTHASCLIDNIQTLTRQRNILRIRKRISRQYRITN